MQQEGNRIYREDAECQLNDAEALAPNRTKEEGFLRAIEERLGLLTRGVNYEYVLHDKSGAMEWIRG